MKSAILAATIASAAGKLC